MSIIRGIIHKNVSNAGSYFKLSEIFNFIFVIWCSIKFFYERKVILINLFLEAILVLIYITFRILYVKVVLPLIPQIRLRKPNLCNYKNGTIPLGYIIVNRDRFVRFKLNIEDIKRHILIYGQTGTGKTWFLQSFLRFLTKKYPDLPFLLFEFKGEYELLKNFIPNLHVVLPGINFSFDIFDHDIFPLKIYPEILFDSLKSCQIIENNTDFTPQMEKVFIDVIDIVCKTPSKHSWTFFMSALDEYAEKNKNTIPLIHQTVINIKNRLRRYYTGPLSRLFEKTENLCTISDLLKKKCLIELGSIQKLGGSKEDVLFFANLVLKWIWETNMLKKPSNSLSHITIFEDASYIASRRLLESSKLSTYLEDIALLLRGKGEALITLTSSLDISRNIIQNAGSKFFFKFNEKKEDVIHNIGFNSDDHIDINQLNVGFCIAKIDSIPYPFLFKPRLILVKKSKLSKKLTSKTKSNSPGNISQEKRNEVQKISETIDDNSVPRKCIKKMMKSDFDKSIHQEINEIVSNKKRNLEPLKQKELLEAKDQQKNIINISLFHFDSIIGPYLYFKFGTHTLDKEHIEHLTKFMNYQTGNYVIEYKNFQHFLYLFEIDSKWARGGKEFLEITISIQKDRYSKQISNNEVIFNNLLDTIKKIKANEEIYQAFYLKNIEKKPYLSQILYNKKIIVEILKSLFRQIYKLINFVVIQQIFSTTPEIYQELNELETKIEQIRLTEGSSIQ